jgi:hypothetical protein
MGRQDLALVLDAEAREHFVGVAHRLPIGLAAHDDADFGLWFRAHKGVVAPGRNSGRLKVFR